MPELPDILVYLDALGRTTLGRRIERIELRSPFLVRTIEPELAAAVSRRVVGLSRLGKRIVWALEGELFLVFHLMIAGRFHWKKPQARPRAKTDLAAFAFEHGVLMLTEASPKRRASLHVLQGSAALAEHDRGGLEVLECTAAEFRETLLRENHTLKRALADPRLFSGIGNAYSDEILHAARLSPVRLTSRLTGEEVERLFASVQSTLRHWIDTLLAESRDTFPEKVTAFREGMAAHGRFGQPCPVCGAPIQRIVYSENETNYCPRCQTEGKLLADRSLSRLLRDDWPKTVEELM